jgi:hypothetical protein
MAEFDAATQAAKERHYRICGEVVWEWNELHKLFGYVFTTLLGTNNIAVAPALWHTPGSDKAQRDLLRTAVEWADGVGASRRDRLHWALKQADRLGPLRNDIVHGVGGILITEDGMSTHLSSGANSFRRVLNRDRVDTPFHDLAAALCEDLRRLQRFVLTIWRTFSPPVGSGRSPRYFQPRSLALVAEGIARTHLPPRRKRTGTARRAAA